MTKFGAQRGATPNWTGYLLAVAERRYD